MYIDFTTLWLIILKIISATVVQILDAIGRRTRQRLDVPLGGLQVILCGDFFQLPPVNCVHNTTQTPFQRPLHSIYNGNNDVEQRFCFQSSIWRRLIHHHFELQQVYRQQHDPVFISLLQSIRWGHVSGMLFYYDTIIIIIVYHIEFIISVSYVAFF